MSLLQQQCVPQAVLLSTEEVVVLLDAVLGWDLVDSGTALVRKFIFPDYYQTMAFVNAVAYVAHQQDHHPELQLSYGRVEVQFRTHSAGGLTLNDFICAARVGALLGV